MKQTLAEKILSAHADHDVHAGELAVISVDVCLTQDGTGHRCRTDRSRVLIVDRRRHGYSLDKSRPSSNLAQQAAGRLVRRYQIGKILVADLQSLQ